MKNENLTYTCQNCGGEVRFDVRAQKFLCTACKTEYQAETETDVVTEKKFNEQKLVVSSTELSDVSTATCDNCGSEIFFPAGETAAHCPMCGASRLRAGAAKAAIRPDGIVPFKIDAQEAQNGFRKFISKRFFAPSALKNAFQEGKLDGWYLPFWTFDADANGTYTGEGGRDVKVTKDGKETTERQWIPVRGNVSKSFDDMLVCASRKESDSLVLRLGSYDTSEVKPYSGQYLQGYMAEFRTIEAAESYEEAKTRMQNSLEAEARADICRTYSASRNVRVNALFSNITCKSILLPLYRACYTYKGKVYDYTINGQTGAVSSDYPKSALKIFLTILSIAAVIAGIVLLTKLH